MDITRFYELRKRLYLTAASGTQTVSEDFRLKRAVEEFGGEMASSKPMMKLYSLCGKLFSADNPADTLAECIALADALAVVQGSFSDISETEPSCVDYNFTDIKLHYSDIDRFTGYMTGAPKDILFSGSITPAAIKDPRILLAFLNSLNSRELPESTPPFTENYGKSLVPVLKQYMKNAPDNAVINCIRLIRQLSGAEENQLFADIAENTEYPDEVRASAAEAMDCSYENVPVLIKLYHTEKSKVKNGAAAALGRLDPPEAEDIWRKLLEKPTKSGDKLLSAARSHIITEYVRNDIFGAIDDYRNTEEESWKCRISRYIELLKSKTDCSDILILLLKQELFVNDITELLVENMRMNPDDIGYRQLIDDVMAQTDRAAAAWIIKNIIFGGSILNDEKAMLSECFEQLVFIAKNIRYSNSMGKYLIPFSFLYTRYCCWAAVNDSTVKRLTEYLSDTEVIISFIALELDPAEMKRAAKGAGGEEALQRGFVRLMSMANDCCKCLERLDIQKAAEFSRLVSKYCPGIDSVGVLHRSNALTPDNSKGIFAAYVQFLARHFTTKQASCQSKYREAEQIIDTLPLTAEQKIAELTDINNKLRLPLLAADSVAAELKKLMGKLIEKYENKLREEGK